MAYRIVRQAGDETNHFLLVAGRFYFIKSCNPARKAVY